jgi:acyl-CoA hydrolase
MWIDEIASMAASLNFRECHFVTVGTKEFAFHRSVRKGAILSLGTKQIHRGKTSVRYFENVLREDEEIFSTEVTQVGVDEPGQKQSFPNGEFFVSLPLPIL